MLRKESEAVRIDMELSVKEEKEGEDRGDRPRIAGKIRRGRRTLLHC